MSQLLGPRPGLKLRPKVCKISIIFKAAGGANTKSASMFDGCFNAENHRPSIITTISALGDDFPENILSTAAGSR